MKGKKALFITTILVILIILVSCGGGVKVEEIKDIEGVKESIVGCVGEGEEITDVVIDGKDIVIKVDLGEEDDTMPISIEDLAITRYSSITDKLLEQDCWNDIKIEFKDVGEITLNTEVAEENEFGKYFDTLEIMDNFKPKK